MNDQFSSDGARAAYAAVVTGQLGWRTSADQLLLAARALRPAADQWWEAPNRPRDEKGAWAPCPMPVYFMLMALAMENLLKCKIAAQQESDLYEQTRNRKRIPTELLGHDLIVLCKRAGMEYTADEEYLLRRLSHNSIWAGRYPAPVRHEWAAWVGTLDDGRELGLNCHINTDLAALDALVARLT